MQKSIQPLLTVLSFAAIAAALVCRTGPVQAWGDSGGEDPTVDNSHTSQALEALPRVPVNKRSVVTIYQFRSGVPEVNAAAATDMFTTALVKSGAFVVAERNQMQDVTAEKRLNGQGLTTGNSAQQRLTAAHYIFEGTVSEANQGESNSGGGISLGGMHIGGGGQQDSIGIDVRVLDANSGLVLDAVNVRKKIESSGGSVSSVGSLAQSIAGLSGHSIPLDPDVSVHHSHQEGVDAALRSCIEEAVLTLVKRYGGAGS
ncbi:MAG: CsgG/HfaB family protein [Stenotrophobium sp.]